MFFSDLDTLTKEAKEVFGAEFPLEEETPKQYVHMKYPSWLPLMRFETHQYRAEGFGTMSTFLTTGMGGRMKLATMVFTPSKGVQVPLLLLDCMVMPKREMAVCFVEFYDCTEHGAGEDEAFVKLYETYREYPSYPEQPAWYIKERTPYSLIKSDSLEQKGEGVRGMVEDAVRAYTSVASRAPKREGEARKLLAFQQRMVTEGNPSSSILEKVLGKNGAADFFKSVIMPV